MGIETRLQWIVMVSLIAALSGATGAAAGVAESAHRDRAGVEGAPEADAQPLAPGAPLGVVVAATLVARENDVPPGETDPVVTINAPFTNALGVVGFTGALTTVSGTDNFVWLDDGITWRNSDETVFVLTGAEGTMGISDTGGFIYSPSISGNDGVWTQNGKLLADRDPAPGFPPPALSVFNSRPRMVATGQAYWVGGVSTTGGTTTDARALFTSPSASGGDIQVVLRSGDMVGGFAIRGGSSGIDFDYDVSSDGAHLVQVLQLDTGSTADDDFVYVDGALVARITTPTGDGDNWAAFDSTGINVSGHYLFSGDTDGVTTTDEFIAYDGAIAIREGDTLGGVALVTPAAVNALSIADDGQAAHLWSTSGGIEILFHACAAADLAASSAVLRTADQVDLDGDGIPDATVTGFNASGAVGPGLDLAGDGRVFVEVTLDDGGGDEDAVIALDLPLCMPFLDGFETGDTGRWSLTLP
ncbi:MAG: hypothetical protein F9K18_03810 [Thermoanaerobaculia bacterium]|nr:MAG: hypothetical protein F9K18_03810 [Thermoanaerobaculia bacterium]